MVVELELEEKRVKEMRNKKQRRIKKRERKMRIMEEDFDRLLLMKLEDLKRYCDEEEDDDDGE